MRRREFLTLSAASIGGVLVYSLDREVFRLSAQADKSICIPLRFFSQAEALIVAAAASRIFPSDEAGPGAREASVAVYIDRQLAGPWGRDLHRYTQGPFEENAPAEFGYQGQATPQQIYRQGLKELKAFDRRGPDEQDQKLKQIEASLFFSLLRQNTIEDMFCDPMHGGNIDMLGWQLIGFPGPRMSNFDDSVLARLVAKYDYEKIGQGRLTNDALIAMSAARLGITVITANARDFLRLAEFRPFQWKVHEFSSS